MSPKYVNIVKIIYMLHIFDITIHNRHDITEIVLEVALNTITITNFDLILICLLCCYRKLCLMFIVTKVSLQQV